MKPRKPRAPRAPSPGSGSMNPIDQPRTCSVCAQPVKSSESAEFFYDLTAARQHRSTHIACKQAGK